MLLEMHCHTAEHSECSSISACELVRQVYAKGLQGIVFTDHHFLWSEDALKRVRHVAEVPEHFLIFSGQEVSTAECGDVLVYGATKLFPPRTSLVDIRDEFPDAALVWAHPYRKGRRPTVAALRNAILDGIEIFNSNHTVLENSRALRDWHQQRFTAIGGTDTHGGSYAGLYPTIFDHPVKSIFDLATEIRHGRCRPFLKEIPRAGANSLVTEVTFGTKGRDEVRERLIIKEISSAHKWRSEERAHEIMSQLIQHGFADGPYRVPRLIDDDPDSMTLIEQGLRAKSLYDKLLTSNSFDGREYIERSATWLARLHNCRLKISSSDEFLVKEESRLDKYLERFTDISHRHARKVGDLIHALRDAERKVVQASADLMVQGHGDYHPKNIFLGQDCQEDRSTLFVAAIDFESSLILPRAFDVGCFLSQFRNQFFAHPDILQRYPEQVFLDSYLANSVGVESDFSRQVELFRARTNMSIAAYLIKIGMGESENLWRVIVEAERALVHV